MSNRIKSMKISFIILLFLIISVLILFQFNCFWRLFYPIKYQEIIIENAETYNVDPYLIAAVIFVESKYVETAESRRGALGLMQIMPETGVWIAEKLDIENYDHSDLSRPDINIMFGSWYIANLKQEFADEIIVLAAYNAGRGNVKKWLTDRWDGQLDTIEIIPFTETRNYIMQVRTVYERYKQIYELE